MSDELPTVIEPVPEERPIVRVPAAPVEGIMVGIASDVPVAFWKLRSVTVPVVAVRVDRLARLETFKFVVVAPIPEIVKPPLIVVLTLVEPRYIPPIADEPVPIKIELVPAPVAIFTVDEVPIPRLSV